METEALTPKSKCGIIMPISEHPDYSPSHWKDVLSILTEAIKETQFESRLVSDDVAIGLIHERIVNNIYNDDIVICDVSSKNPNVMFELGMRLAFDKPTIIIKDERTGYSFDTGVIEHISYPSSLRFSQIVEFKQELIRKINATYNKSKSEPNFSPFLKSFGKTIIPSKINQTEIAESKYILERLEILSNDLKRLSFNQSRLSNSPSDRQKRVNVTTFELLEINNPSSEEDAKDLQEVIMKKVCDDYGFTPNLSEISIALNSYLTQRRSKRESV